MKILDVAGTRALEIILEPSSYMHLVAGFRSGQPWLRFILPKIALLFDQMHYFGEPPPN
jgi:hypothetical protein